MLLIVQKDLDKELEEYHKQAETNGKTEEVKQEETK